MPNPFGIPEEMPEWMQMGDTQQSNFADTLAPSLDALKIKVGQMRQRKAQGAAGAGVGGMLGDVIAPEAEIKGGVVSAGGKSGGGMKPHSL